MTNPNEDLADELAELAALLRAAKADRFRVRAYERAARAVRAAPVAVMELDDRQIMALQGIGSAIAGLIAERRDTGRMRLLDELRAQEPPGVGSLLCLPLIGLRDARALAGHGITDLGALRSAAADPEGLLEVDQKLAARVRESLRRQAATAGEGMPLPLARRLAEAMADDLAEVEGVEAVQVAGEVRRHADTVDEIDLVATGAGAVDGLLAGLEDSDGVVRVLHRGEGHLEVLSRSGRRARLWAAEDRTAGRALLEATGSAAHLDALRTHARRTGTTLPATAEDEGAVYAALGLSSVPPPLREGSGEVDAAAEGRLPVPVGGADLQGDLHVHSDWSRDGKDGLEEMVRAAAARGYRYVAITDHAENLAINGMPREVVLARREAIGVLREQVPEIAILDGAELNIGLDGGLDYDLEFLLGFELCVASIHSHMARPQADQTERILAAIAHPAVHVIGHPTGRIIGSRPGYEIDMTAIAQAAAETGTALEVNGSPRRLDLAGPMGRIAVGAGALLSLASDAHRVGELDYVDDAVATAQRAWAESVDVLNARDLAGVRSFTLAKRRRG